MADVKAAGEIARLEYRSRSRLSTANNGHLLNPNLPGTNGFDTGCPGTLKICGTNTSG